MKNTIYGITYKYEFGQWNYTVHAFNSEEKAQKWLDTETYNFNEREIMSKEDIVEWVKNNTDDEEETIQNAFWMAKEMMNE